jgi:hypothetical protein
MTDMTTQILPSHLWRGGAWANYWTPDGPSFTWANGTTEQAKLTHWFPTGRRPPVPCAWAEKNVYFSVHPCTKIPPTNAKGKLAKPNRVRSQIEFIAAVNCVFAEYDAGKGYSDKGAIWAHLDTLPLYPTCVVDSGGGLHAYWFIEHTQPVTDDNRSYYQMLQAAWVDLVGSDNGAKDLARILRLPGYQNHKPHYAPHFPTVAIVEYEARRVFPFYRLAELVDERIEAIQETQHRRATEDAARTDDVAPGAASVLLEWAVRHAQTGSRHHMALWLTGRLKKEGLAQWAADSVLREFARRVSVAGTRQLDETEMQSIVAYVWGKT